MSEHDDVNTFRDALRDAAPRDIMARAFDHYGPNLCLASSLGKEDQVLTHLIARNDLPIEIVTLDTGRLFSETHALLEETRRHYGISIRVAMPDPEDLEDIVSERGSAFFRESVADRKHCCFLRKVRPLRRMLRGRGAWLTGLRRDQSQNRGAVTVAEWDEANELVKINPLWNWDDARLERYVTEHQIPVNALHAKGFPSIGCAPCTRAVAPGEHPRAGRWWWESDQQRECGIHLVDGRLVRTTGGPS